MPRLIVTLSPVLIAFTAACSMIVQKRTILGLASRHLRIISFSSFSVSPIRLPPIFSSAPSASTAILPFARSSAFSPCFSTLQWNICPAVAQYISPPCRNTSSTQFSPASHAITRASIAEKSQTWKTQPGFAINAVRISSESTCVGFS